MLKKRRTKKTEQEKSWAEDMKLLKEAQAENRRKLLATLSPESREFAEDEFAKLGLYQ